jgi:lipoate-protein ligase A
MILICNPCYEAAFNLALEEYALTQMEEELIILWRNSKAVIIGRNQNTVEEVNLDYVREHGIVVIRRLSGGGAVFHDLGNINYTVINVMTQDFGAYEKFTAPVCAYLKTLGVNACPEGRNDLFIDGRKFSGSAQTVKKGRIMHHGCILFSADLNGLGKALKPKTEKIESRGIKSLSRQVTNVCEHLPTPMTPEVFLDGMADYFRDHVEGLYNYILTPQDTVLTHKLAAEKYSNWEWNFGQSPEYNWGNSKRYPFGTVDVRLEVKQGVIRDIRIFGDFFGMRDKEALEDCLRGVRHERKAIAGALKGLDLRQYIHGIHSRELLDLLY